MTLGGRIGNGPRKNPSHLAADPYKDANPELFFSHFLFNIARWDPFFFFFTFSLYFKKLSGVSHGHMTLDVLLFFLICRNSLLRLVVRSENV